MRELIVKLGQVKTILIITIFSIIASELMYFILGELLIDEVHWVGFTIGFIVPATLAPITSWYTIGLLIKIHHLEVEMRDLATYDDLTKLLSRKAFMANAENIYIVSKSENSQFAILYIDIDNFKNINDKYGHIAGDEVLKSFAKILKDIKRENDFVGRLGGEEFAYILPETDCVGASSFAKRLRESVNSQFLDFHDSSIKYTISMGISIYDKNNDIELDHLIKQADDALYKAKHSGKDCIVVHDVSN